MQMTHKYIKKEIIIILILGTDLPVSFSVCLFSSAFVLGYLSILYKQNVYMHSNDGDFKTSEQVSAAEPIHRFLHLDKQHCSEKDEQDLQHSKEF